jgi:thiosulfate dehydrogenase (quinone) large subunit
VRDRIVAYCLLRATLGLNIAMHGISRLVAGGDHFANSLVSMFHSTILPTVMVRAFGYTLPWMEATIGLFVLFGLWTRYALTAGAVVMLLLTFGSTLRQDWEIAGLQLNYSIVFAALLAFHNWNSVSLDRLITGSKASAPISR